MKQKDMTREEKLIGNEAFKRLHDFTCGKNPATEDVQLRLDEIVSVLIKQSGFQTKRKLKYSRNAGEAWLEWVDIPAQA